MFLLYIVVVDGKPQRLMLSPLLCQEGRWYCPSFILMFVADVEPHILPATCTLPLPTMHGLKTYQAPP